MAEKRASEDPWVKLAWVIPGDLYENRSVAGALAGGSARRDGAIISLNYGKVVSLALDSVEKKPLRRFHPGGRILSVGSFGCNLRCPFCQNHEISMCGDGELETAVP